MKTLEEIIQTTVNRSYEELKEFAALGLQDCIQSVGKYVGKNIAAIYVLKFTATVIGADGEISEEERRLIEDLFQEESDTFFESFSVESKEDFFEMIDTIKSFDSETQSALCTLAITIACVDEHVNKNELSYIYSLFNS